jgi:hypothetical protein
MLFNMFKFLVTWTEKTHAAVYLLEISRKRQMMEPVLGDKVIEMNYITVHHYK